ncbi:14411_t:CDS:2 [Entrophospora sp. SA101]|nr:14411_t:CDS:2 [Entrophospora sp. SA101]
MTGNIPLRISKERPDSGNAIANNSNNINGISSLNNSSSSNFNMKRSFTELEEDSENDTICSDYNGSIENQSGLFDKNDVLEIIKKIRVNDLFNLQ